jgi:hypothetical protein
MFLVCNIMKLMRKMNYHQGKNKVKEIKLFESEGFYYKFY